MVLSELKSTLFFSLLRLSHAGRYTCDVTVNEAMYTSFYDIVLSKFSADKKITELCIIIIIISIYSCINS